MHHTITLGAEMNFGLQYLTEFEFSGIVILKCASQHAKKFLIGQPRGSNFYF